MLPAECAYMPIDLCYVIPLPSRMRVIPNCFYFGSLLWPVFPYFIPEAPEQLYIILRIAI